MATKTNWLEKRVKVTNKLGLHARAAVKVVRTASEFDAQVKLANTKNLEEEVTALSVLGLMMVSASYGSSVRIRSKGKQAKEALDAVSQLFAEKFNEE